jgi:Rha family phage regulatory protein
MTAKQSPAPTLNELVLIHKEKAVTTSRKIAETFGKNHKEVLRDIENLRCSKEFTQRNFALSSYKDKSGKKNKEFEVSKDGVVMLIMGYTGLKAMQFKESYINAFNQMEEVLTKRAYGESHTLTEIRKAVPNKIINELWRGEGRLYQTNKFRKYIGYGSMNAGERERYKELFNKEDGVLWCTEEYVLTKMRARTALNQRQAAIERCGELAQRAVELRALYPKRKGGSHA